MNKGVSGIPMYFQIADDFREKIKSRELITGDKLPSEHEVMEMYNVSRGTVRKSLQKLQQDGIIDTYPGKGSVVASTGIEYNAGKVLGYFSHVAKEAGKTPTGKVIEMKMINKAPGIIKEKLKMTNNEAVLFLKRVRYVDKEAWNIENSWFVRRVSKIIQNIDLVNGSLYEGLRWGGVTFYRSKNRIAAQSLSLEDAELLNLPEGTAAMSVSRVMYQTDNIPFEYSEDLFRSDRLRLSLDVNYQVDSTDFKLKPSDF